MDAFHPGQVFSSIDSGGRYAYGNQPRIAHWNLVRLAQALLPLLADDETAALASAREAINTFPGEFERAYFAGLRRKLGLVEEHENDMLLAGELLELMAANKADYTLTFRLLADGADAVVRGQFQIPAAFDAWMVKWRERLALESVSPEERVSAMRAVNPAFVPRNHRIEAAIVAAQTNSDFSLFEELVQVLATPFADQPQFSRYTEPPTPDEVVHQTFCGT
jgi:uncharacterized protein YdiU (UPF0061 family)